ncbi:hypothetical protein SEMRO_2508_G329740.1 [Seminavis robusta]|uniref:Uncharacterized protein n=1 Tax=Seminavis robusta TaxID=568900 RepID=A0A9N8EYL0_9STRA|nr:hypothetical protein SEMRO_2508_G329740.1 [Seminavis robusta]|eukprot:Sro2508_g329740.1 n/a (122) ;mRNA; f:4831-5196
MYDEITGEGLESIAEDVARTIGIEVVHEGRTTDVSFVNRLVRNTIADVRKPFQDGGQKKSKKKKMASPRVFLSHFASADCNSIFGGSSGNHMPGSDTVKISNIGNWHIVARNIPTLWQSVE